MAMSANEKQKLSPMMLQYLTTKENYKDTLLFCRLGDFYELFFDDAITVSRELDLTLTGRSCGLDERAPMCGVPYHAADSYIAKLVNKGYKVAILEQLTEPRPGQLVERAVVRTVTPGTVIENSMLDETKNNYILCLYKNKTEVGVSYCDISTGEFYVAEFNDNIINCLNDVLTRIMPAEIICNTEMQEIAGGLLCVKQNMMPKFESYPDVYFDFRNAAETLKKQLGTASLAGQDFAKLNDAVCAAGALISYLKETQKRELSHINKIISEKDENYLYLDPVTVRNLELTETLREQKRQGSLIALLDNTKTSMGARKLRSWILQPVRNEIIINDRLNSIEELINEQIKLNDIIELLCTINDIERLTARISYGSINPRDCITLKNSLKNLPQLKNLLADFNSNLLKNSLLNFKKAQEIAALIEQSIDEEAPLMASAGGVIKQGFNKDLDSLKQAATDGQKWLSALEATEKEKTGIKNLKIGYTRVFGYYIEVLRSQQELVPFRYQRKQTVANSERYVTDELKEIEEKILNSEELSIKLEQQLFNEIKKIMLDAVQELQIIAKDIAGIDCLCSLATVSKRNNYVKPVINKSIKSIKIIDGRHPVVETLLKNEVYVPNDCFLDNKDNRTMLITGPNMAGKSTYMRQAALITLLAHIGCFVPAKLAEISLTDRIFTRIGASDDLSYGQSTFMVEMMEVSNIINNATEKSLILLDEVGRGTSTFDGLSIAWAVIEYITSKIKAKTLFATHFHELTELEGVLDGAKNYRVSVKEYNNSIIFLHKIVRGGANRSFGIEVAGLAGIDASIIDKAKQILHTLEQNEINESSKLKKLEAPVESSVTGKEIQALNLLKDIDINKLSPMDAFQIIADLKEKIR